MSSHAAWQSLLVTLPAVVVLSDNEVWSLYGAVWLQPVAINRKSADRRSGRNKPKPLPRVATLCIRRYMVRWSMCFEGYSSRPNAASQAARAREADKPSFWGQVLGPNCLAGFSS